MLNYREYIVSAEWKRFRIAKLTSVNFKCEHCKTGKATQVHHKHYRTLGHESFEDVEALCRACHQLIHKILKKKNRKSSVVWPF